MKGPENSSLYRMFVKPGEFIKNLLAGTRETKHLVHCTGKFVILGVRYTGIIQEFNCTSNLFKVDDYLRKKLVKSPETFMVVLSHEKEEDSVKK